MWERSVGDSDFGHVRVGAGTQRLCRSIILPPIAPLTDLDTVTADAFRRFVHTYSAVADLPIALALRGTPRVAVTGPAAGVRALVRSMICQLAVSHSPDTILIAAIVGRAERESWDWLKWLPHNRHPSHGAPMVFDAGVTVDDVPAGAAGPISCLSSTARAAIRLWARRRPPSSRSATPATTRFACISTASA